jgi:hypothetical protein
MAQSVKRPKKYTGLSLHPGGHRFHFKKKKPSHETAKASF